MGNIVSKWVAIRVRKKRAFMVSKISLALDKGYNLCPTWIYSSQCMAHFTELRRVIRENHD